MSKEIKITCDGSHNLKLNEIHNFQGDLKELTDENKKKLKKSLIKYGFSFPFFCWKDKDEKIWFEDGHSRCYVLKELEFEGYKLPETFPVCFIQAKDKKEAAEKLLLLNSKFGKITDEGLELYLDKFELNDDFAEFSKLLNYDEIKLDEFVNENYNENENISSNSENNLESIYEVAIECDNETEQKKVYEKITEMGYKCRLLTL